MARRDRFDGRGGPRDARRFTSDRDPLLPSDDGNGKSTHPSTSPDSYMAVFSSPRGKGEGGRPAVDWRECGRGCDAGDGTTGLGNPDAAGATLSDDRARRRTQTLTSVRVAPEPPERGAADGPGAQWD